jgi:hypothetical protein
MRLDDETVLCDRLRAAALELTDRQRRATQLPVAEPADWAREAEGDPMLIEFCDHRELVREVAGSHVAVEHHRIPDAEVRDCCGRSDRVEQFAARVDSVSDRDQMLVEAPRGNRIKQLALGASQCSILRSGPEHRWV